MPGRKKSIVCSGAPSCCDRSYPQVFWSDGNHVV